MKRVTHTWTDKKSGQLYALFTYTDTFGKRHFQYRKARNVSHAKDLYKAMEREHEKKGDRAFDSRRMTFNDLADYYKPREIKPPVYVNTLKAEGMRSWKDAEQKLSVLREYFGRIKLSHITEDVVKEFKRVRLGTPTRRVTKQRTIASVDRELSLLRKMLNTAKRKGWIHETPFGLGAKIISNTEEKKRQRIISRDEETRLLSVCTGRREHLRPIIICALDTGMRSGEMFKLCWRDVHLNTRKIRIDAFNTKDAKEREVPITERLAKELEGLWKISIKDRDGLVFGMTRMKRGWRTACRLASLDDVTFHDCRHSAATRLIQQGRPLAEVSRILGHASPITTYRYINPSDETISRAADALNEFNLRGL